MAYTNFYATRLATDIGAADTSIEVEIAPSVTSGRLTLEARNPTQREIISYTGLTLNTLTGVTRGVGGTTARPHTKGSLVEMNVTAEDLTDALNVPNDIETRFNEVISDHVASGLVWTDDTGLTADMSAGVAYINGKRLEIDAVINRAFTASKDTYIDLGDNGVIDYNEVSNGAAQPALAASHIRLGFVRTNATDTTVVNNYPNPSYLEKSDGWQKGLPAVSSVTNNGNRSYDVVFNSSVASTLSEGMRLRTTRTVAAPTYMGGAFNGSSHYFTKTSPTGTLGTVTNNFSIKATIQPTAYSYGGICGNIDSVPANGWFMDMMATGQIRVGVYNGGAANYSIHTTYQSVPLNKKTKVWATWTSGTVVIYFNGVAVPTSLVNSGTLPVVAAAGGTFSIGRAGAVVASLFTGYISDVAVFNAVLSQATIRSYDTYGLTGSETNCIGAWNLNNTAVNQQAPGTNDLTATGGVGYTNISPYGNNGLSSTLDYALVMAVSGANVTVQVPEGCTIPTSGGITSVSYSTMACPYGFVSDKGRWEVSTIGKVNAQQSTPTANTWYASNLQISVPIGDWELSYKVLASPVKITSVSGSLYLQYATISTSSSSETNLELTTYAGQAAQSATDTVTYSQTYVERPLSTDSMAIYYLIYKSGTNALTTLNFRGDLGATVISVLPSGL